MSFLLQIKWECLKQLLTSRLWILSKKLIFIYLIIVIHLYSHFNFSFNVIEGGGEIMLHQSWLFWIIAFTSWSLRLPPPTLVSTSMRWALWNFWSKNREFWINLKSISWLFILKIHTLKFSCLHSAFTQYSFWIKSKHIFSSDYRLHEHIDSILQHPNCYIESPIRVHTHTHSLTHNNISPYQHIDV